jgi:hypothetical protein
VVINTNVGYFSNRLEKEFDASQRESMEGAPSGSVRTRESRRPAKLKPPKDALNHGDGATAAVTTGVGETCDSTYN